MVDYGIQRESLNEIETNVQFASIISGVRRCGKSTLLRQLIKKLKGFYYFNFEDPKAINFELEDFQKLNDVFKEEYGSYDYYFFDEIQNVHKWELFVRTMLDKDKKNCHYWLKRLSFKQGIRNKAHWEAFKI